MGYITNNIKVGDTVIVHKNTSAVSMHNDGKKATVLYIDDRRNVATLDLDTYGWGVYMNELELIRDWDI